MVNLLSCANCKVKLPAPKQTREQVIKMFKQQMMLLKDHLNVGTPFFQGLIHVYTHLTEHCHDWENQPEMGHMAG